MSAKVAAEVLGRVDEPLVATLWLRELVEALDAAEGGVQPPGAEEGGAMEQDKYAHLDWTWEALQTLRRFYEVRDRDPNAWRRVMSMLCFVRAELEGRPTSHRDPIQSKPATDQQCEPTDFHELYGLRDHAKVCHPLMTLPDIADPRGPKGK